MEKTSISVGIIGLGARGETLLASMFLMDYVNVTAICDQKQERIDFILSKFDERSLPRPAVYQDYHQLLQDPAVEAVFVPTSWNSHLKIAIDAMKSGKSVGIEVGGAASIQELWDLVRAAESTGVSCMMLENCCYARNELMVLNMVRQGLFGELIYCECGYEHSLGNEFARDYTKHLERPLHNIHRNGDLYPTHGIGPIAKILEINRGNRFLTISSHATKSRGYNLELQRYNQQNVHFNCGDVVTSVIHCANGENITLTHAVSLPRPYSRDCRVQGTKGIWLENANGIYIEGISPCESIPDLIGTPCLHHRWDTVESFYENYDHPIWKQYGNAALGGHGGIDILTIRAFLDSVVRHIPAPIDVYDCASWMAITCLSEQSIALGGMPVSFPDFTDGRWVDRKPKPDTIWAL